MSVALPEGKRGAPSAQLERSQEDAMEFEVVLASASPRRRQLLEEAGVRFRVHSVDVDESLEPDLLENPTEAVKRLAERKARAAVERLMNEGFTGSMVVLGSDTMVVFRGEVFGKPRDRADAERMLSALSGHGHDVHTAVSLWAVHVSDGSNGRGEAESLETSDDRAAREAHEAYEEDRVEMAYRTFVDTTYVYFKELSDLDISEYIATGDPFDKAGAYGIQSGASAFVDHIEGSLDTVIGLPVHRLLNEYPEFFGLETGTGR